MKGEERSSYAFLDGIVMPQTAYGFADGPISVSPVAFVNLHHMSCGQVIKGIGVSKHACIPDLTMIAVISTCLTIIHSKD